MLLKEFATPSIIEGSEDDHEVHSYHHLDELLVKLCGMVVESLKEGPPAPWMVAAGIKTKEYPFFARTGHMSDSGHVHAEHVVLKEFTAKYGEVPEGSIMLVTLSPCNRHDDKTAHQRVGESCSELIAEHGIEKVYCGLIDPSQAHGSHDHRHYTLIETENASIRALCEQFANTFLHGEERIYEAAAWQKKSGKNKNGGLNQKGVNSYRREHPGSKLKTAVTTKPSKLKKGSKASKRRKSFCARMKGMKKHRTGSKTAHDPNSRINKSLRKWHCESIEEMRDLIMLGESYIAEVKQRLDAKCWKGKHKDGTKIKGGIRVNNCVPNESVEEIEEFIDVNKAPENFDVYADSDGSDYDFTVGKTKIEVTFKEYNENYYILAFENTTQRRPDTHAATGTERDTVFGIFNGVAYCLNHFIARHPKTEVIVMGAKSNELSRVKLYDRAAKFFEQMGFKAVTDPVQQKRIFNDDASGYKLYIYKKKNAMEMTTESTELKRHETIKNIMQSKDAFIGFIKSQNNSVDEAANAAQQAAIAIAKKKRQKSR
jgi:pyrimidine deaminase RibD-like protein